MASPRLQQKKERRDQISSQAKNKAQTAKEYIEYKYSRRKQEDSERKLGWSMLSQKMSELNLNTKERILIKQEILHREAEQMRQKRQKISVSRFESIKIIGKGAFGEVRVVRDKKTQEVLAMKRMNKREMIEKNQIEHIKAERNVLSAPESPWIVDLKMSFQDEDSLYLVMEYLAGGDLMNLLIKKDILSETEAQFYIAEIILAIDSVHKMNYIHRDLKPDNILIDDRGHIKLSDFGLSKHTEINPQHKDFSGKRGEFRRDRKLAYSTVGTPDYIAPEVFTRKGYSETVDWWSVGIILFEMLVGYPPFYADQPSDVCHKIMHWKKHFAIPNDARLSRSAKDLILRLVAEPHERIGNRGVDEIKAHPFFLGVDWNRIHSQTPPFVPEIRSEIDTSNFDEFEEAQPLQTNNSSRKKLVRKDLDFVGYTFKKDDENQRSGLIAALEELEAIKQSSVRPKRR